MSAERGQVGGIEALPFGLLIFVVGALLVASAWAVVDTKLAVVSAAREAARTYVEADATDEARAAAAAAPEEAMAAHGRAGEVTVEFDDPATFARCASVTVRVSYEVPAVPLPWIGGLGTTTVAARHTERIDPYREGPPGVAVCPP
jgi:Flp pilus assembly protein TadG